MTMIIGGTSRVTYPDSTVQTTAPIGGGGVTAFGNTVLTSSSSGSQSITPTTWGQTVTLPSATTMSKGACVFNINNAGGYPLKIVDNAGNTLGFIYQASAVTIGLADNSTAAGVWNISGAEFIANTALFFTSSVNFSRLNNIIKIDSTRFFILVSNNSTRKYYGIIYDSSSQTFGTPTLIGTPGYLYAGCILSATNQILAWYTGSSAISVVTLTLSGTTITVNTPVTGSIYQLIGGIDANYNIIQVGTSFVISYYNNSNNVIRGVSISGTVPTIGSEITISISNSVNFYVTKVTSSIFMTSGISSANSIGIQAFSISGSTITSGSSISVATNSNAFRILPISSGARWSLVHYDGTSTICTIVSISGTTPTYSNATLFSGTGAADISTYTDMVVDGSTLIVCSTKYGLANTVTDTSGTATAGTQVVIPAQTNGLVLAISAISGTAIFNAFGASTSYKIVLNYSTPLALSISLVDELLAGTTTYVVSTMGSRAYSGQRPIQALLGSQSFGLQHTNGASSANGKITSISSTGYYAYASKWNLPNTLGSNTCFIGTNNNDVWMVNPLFGTGMTGSALYRVESIT
jgi:hypothetical protein